MAVGPGGIHQKIVAELEPATENDVFIGMQSAATRKDKYSLKDSASWSRTRTERQARKRKGAALRSQRVSSRTFLVVTLVCGNLILIKSSLFVVFLNE